MVALGVPVHPVPQGPDRAPVWPAGLAGSISHSESICLAVVGSARRYAALALDVEADDDLPAGILPHICTPAEQAWLSVQPQQMRGRLARLIFSAKECAYKLQYPVTRKLLDFDAFEITPDVESGQFEATLTCDVAPFGARHQFAGRFTFGAGLVLTAMAMSHSARP
jgi:4'-phosphopantetheinyl transferase EntD